MKKKQYIVPDVEIVLYKVQNLMKVGSDLPDDPTGKTSAPRRTNVF